MLLRLSFYMYTLFFLRSALAGAEGNPAIIISSCHNNFSVHFSGSFAARIQQPGLVCRWKADIYFLQHAKQYWHMINTDTVGDRWKASPSLLQLLSAPAPQRNLTLLVAADKLPWPAILLQPGIYKITIAAGAVDSLLSLKAVRFADLPKKVVPELIIRSSNMWLNRIALLQQNYPLLQGQNMVISLKEAMFDTSDIDLLGKNIPSGVAAAGISEHASIMATLAAGLGNSDVTGKGVAPAAQLSGADYSTNLLPEEDAYYQQYHIGVQNHSYGTPSVENYYGLEALAFDKQAWEQDTLVHVFSSGNIGDSVATAGTYAGVLGFANLSGNFKQAKNVIVVGGTDADNTTPLLSSKGPAYDGRVKPDIVAYGEDGTSGAAALTSGVAALLQQAFLQQTGHRPGNALVKGLLVNSATDIGPAGVDYTNGYGALHAANAMKTLLAGRYLTGVVSNGTTQHFPLTVPAGMGRLTVSLTWSDPPAAIHAPLALVNDLDLQVHAPDGQWLLPWVLAPQPASLQKPAIRGRDSLNNTEQVTLDNPLAGSYTLIVNGYHIPTGPQRFFIVYDWLPAHVFTWEYPLGGSKLEAATTQTLHWFSRGDNTGNISYSLDRGHTWKTLATTLPLQADGFAWALPDTFCTGLLKMETAGQSFVSDTFMISPKPLLHVGFDCSDAGLLWWSTQAGAGSYSLSAITGNLLTPYSLTSDTSLLLPAEGPSYFSLRAITPDGDTGLQSLTYNYHTQGLQCYIQSLNADTLLKGVLLQLQLGTTYHLNSIRWERLLGNDFKTLFVQPVDDRLYYSFVDTTALTGIVYYRVTLLTDAGRAYPSEKVRVNLLGLHPYWLFPNPAQTQFQFFSYLTENVQLQLFDMKGRLVLSRRISNPQTTVPVNQLGAGIYICVVYEKGRRVMQQQLVVIAP
ncbi:Por secretion system C-terminal sorting domain-containing protein [Chitinophaga costaii]|uniref:Por secretion system C-terminal sorting domain-containing protein n=1 Tax=Chitinophaga costaii TaxID=1335309 RepID=A0A1C4E7F5_9BACT|nr:S8 family peptidase [Chitinophaga costaii]PUZ24267.1 T9SS C-terminal target domain-containing protein [Chitinophaga costaii]SCC39587.1 Por secretion system C-terminal sorting domain-containing protein [Chitinophaga costaii]